MSASRYPLALARDGLLPGVIGRVSRRKGSPFVAILLTGILIILALQLNIELLVKSASAVFMMSYIMANVAVIVLRESGLEYYKPLFRAPFYPWGQTIAILVYLFLLADLGWEAFGIALAFVALSLAVFAFYGRHRARHDFALIHLLKRVVDSRWQEEGLDRELMEILHHRDRLPALKDGDVLKKMTVVDLDEDVADAEALFRWAADEVAERLELGADAVLTALKEREADSTTALTQFTAIPHMVLDGAEHRFGIHAYRSLSGIRFTESRPSVRAVFICAGTGDVRDLHLEVLAALARTVQRPFFEDWWVGAENGKDLTARLRKELMREE